MVQELKFSVEKVTVPEVVVGNRNLVFWFAMVGKVLEVVVNNHKLAFWMAVLLSVLAEMFVDKCHNHLVYMMELLVLVFLMGKMVMASVFLVL